MLIGLNARRVVRWMMAVSLICSAGALAAGSAMPPAPSAALGAPPPGVRTVDRTAVGLLSHRAVYEMSLVKVSESDGVRAASGTMHYTLTDRCDGYTTETDMSLNLAYANGNANQVEQRYAAWEAKDGQSSTFRFQVRENGKLAKSYQGNILFKDDGTGIATYEGSEVTAFNLPRGTLLSTAHTLALLKSAAAGERFVSKMVIDGSFDQGPFWVAATIAPSRDGGVSPVKGDIGTLSQGRYWPIGMAYFPASSDQTVPEYEITQNLLGTGVAQSMVQDFGGFTVAFKLVRVEAITAPPC